MPKKVILKRQGAVGYCWGCVSQSAALRTNVTEIIANFALCN